MEQTLDIRYEFNNSCANPWNVLSNLASKPFTFDGLYIRTIECVLQAIKSPDPDVQQFILTLPGHQAKKAGKMIEWRRYRLLYWQGTIMHRDEEEYQVFLDRLFLTCWMKNATFREKLEQSKGYKLDHTIGVTDQDKTILTRSEFISRLEFLRQLKNPA